MRGTSVTCSAAALVLVVACGGRTGLGLLGEGASSFDGGQRDGASDAPPDEARADAERDVFVPDSSPPRCTSNAQCDDEVACTHDRCDLATGKCVHDPDNSLCPSGFACRPPCLAASFAESMDALYGVDLPSGAVTKIGDTGERLLDIALDPGGTLYGVDDANILYTIDTSTAALKRVAVVDVNDINALDFAPDGTLYGSSGGTSGVYAIDPATGRSKEVAKYPDGYTASGDLAVIGHLLLATVVAPGPSDLLVSIDLDTFQTRVIGSIGFLDVWGLAAYGPQLFGYTEQGQVLQIDPVTGEGRLLVTDPGVSFFGASAR